jgi:hypothetical protein
MMRAETLPGRVPTAKRYLWSMSTGIEEVIPTHTITILAYKVGKGGNIMDLGAAISFTIST